MPGRKKGPKKAQSGQGFMDFVKSAHNWVKNNKVISQGANVVGNIASRIPNSYAQGVAEGAKAVEETAKKYGYGKRRVVRRRAVGGSKSAKRSVNGRGYPAPIII